MKKLMIGVMVAATLSACEKEANYVRNYSKPIDIEKPTGVCGGGNIMVEEGISDKEIVKRVREMRGWEDTLAFPIVYLTPYAYDLSQSEENIEYSRPDPNYMQFPHAICSMQDKWGWDYYYEYVNLGEQVFCDKYLNGKLTLGMKLK